MCFDYLLIICSDNILILFVQFLLTLLLQDNKAAFFLKKPICSVLPFRLFISLSL